MPSPFPGMDPYLEGLHWQGFHHLLCTAIARQLTPKLGDKYVEKRERILASSVHLVEIDLLRGGERAPMAESFPAQPYFVLVHRADQRPMADVWPISLDQRLPIIPIPLADDDPDAQVDLQG